MGKIKANLAMLVGVVALCTLCIGTTAAYADDAPASDAGTVQAVAAPAEGTVPADANAEAANSGASTDAGQAAGVDASAGSQPAGTSGAEDGQVNVADGQQGTTASNDSGSAPSDGTPQTAGEANEPTAEGTSDAGNTPAADGGEGVNGVGAPDDEGLTGTPDVTGTTANAGVTAAATAAATTAASATTDSTATAAASTHSAAAKKTASTGGAIANGTYVINLDKMWKLVMDVKGSSTKSGAKILMKTDKNKKSQKWVFTYVAKAKAYTIKNLKSGLYVTLKSVKSGKELVHQAKLKSSSNTKQLWVLSKTGTGYKILSKAKTSLGLGTWSSKALDGYYLTTQNGKANKFKFYLLPVDDNLKQPTSTVEGSLDGKYVNLTLASNSSARVSIEDSSQDNGANVQLQKKSSSNQSQKWYLKCVSSAKGLYKVINLGSGKALQVNGKTRRVSSDVNQGDSSNSQIQQWWISENSDGTYTFKNRFNGLILRSESTSAGANVSLWNAPSAKTKEFKVTSVTPIANGTQELLLNDSTTQALTVPGASAAENVQLQASKYKSNLSQKFKFTKISNGVYTIMALCSNRFLADNGGKVVQGTNVASSGQQWNLVWADNAFALQNATTGKYLYATGSAKNGKGITTTSTGSKTANHVTAVKRHIIDNGGYYIVYGKNGSKVLGVDKSNASKSKAKLKAYAKKDLQYLKFNITYLSTNSAGREVYKILNAQSGMAVTTSGSSLYQLKYAKKNSQKWAVDISADGGIAFINVATGKAISNAKSTKTTAKYNPNSTAYTGKANTENRWTLETTTAFTALQQKAYSKLIKTTSKTKYAVVANLSKHYVWVFQRANKKSDWVLKYEWRCSNGKASTPTPAVNLLSSGYKRYKSPAKNPEGQEYGSSFYYMTYIAKGKYFHTPLYKKGSTTVYKDKRMCKSISNGCVRVETNNAIWIYKNIKKGTRIITYY